MESPVEQVPLYQQAHEHSNKENKIKSSEEFKEAARPFTHFKVKRKYFCGSYFHHFIVVARSDTKANNSEEFTVTIVHYTSEFCGNIIGVGQLKAEELQVAKGEVESLCTFGKDDISQVKYEENQVVDPEKILTEMLLRVGETAYNATDNNCDFAVINILKETHDAPDANKNSCMGKCCGPILDSVKGIGLIVSMMIAFLSAGLGTITRRAYTRVLVAVFVSYIRDDSYLQCRTPLNRNIIQATQYLLEEEKSQYPYPQNSNISYIIEKLENYFDTDSVCKVAEKYGCEVVSKTMGHAFGIWVCLQTAYIFLYVALHLIPMRRVFRRQTQEHKFCLYLFRELCAGYIPIALTMSICYIVQVHLDSPEVAVFFVTVASYAVFRFFVTCCFFCGICDGCSKGNRCSHCCSDAKPRRYLYGGLGLIFLFIIAYTFLTIMHYVKPSFIDTF